MINQRDENDGSFSLHEALHMFSFLAGAVDRELCQHQAIKKNPRLKASADRIGGLLGELYQAIGQERWKTEE